MGKKETSEVSNDASDDAPAAQPGQVCRTSSLVCLEAMDESLPAVMDVKKMAKLKRKERMDDNDDV